MIRSEAQHRPRQPERWRPPVHGQRQASAVADAPTTLRVDVCDHGAIALAVRMLLCRSRLPAERALAELSDRLSGAFLYGVFAALLDRAESRFNRALQGAGIRDGQALRRGIDMTARASEWFEEHAAACARRHPAKVRQIRDCLDDIGFLSLSAHGAESAYAADEINARIRRARELGEIVMRD